MTDAAYSWFGRDRRVTVYEDGTLEIQVGHGAYRASLEMWTEAARELNHSVSHCQAELIQEGKP